MYALFLYMRDKEHQIVKVERKTRMLFFGKGRAVGVGHLIRNNSFIQDSIFPCKKREGQFWRQFLFMIYW